MGGTSLPRRKESNKVKVENLASLTLVLGYGCSVPNFDIQFQTHFQQLCGILQINVMYIGLYLVNSLSKRDCVGLIKASIYEANDINV